MSNYPGAALGGGEFGAGATLGIAKAVLVIDTSQAVAGIDDVIDKSKEGSETVEGFGDSVDKATGKASAGFDSVTASSGRSAGGLRTLLTVSRLVSMTGDRSAAQAIRTVGYVGIVSQRLGGMGDVISTLGGPIEKLGQNVLTWASANLGLEESMAGAIVDVGGLAAGLAAFAIPIGIAIIAIKAISDEFSGLSEAANKGLAQLEKYNDLVSSGKTSDEFTKEAEKAKDAEDARRVAMDKATVALAQAHDQFKQFGVGANFTQLLAQLGVYGSTLQDVQKAYDDAVKNYNDAQSKTSSLTLAAASPEAQLAQKRADALNATKLLISEEEKAAQQKESDAKLIKAGNVKAVQDEIDNQNSVAANQTELAENLQASYQSLVRSGHATSDQLDVLKAAIDKAQTSSSEASARAKELSGTTLQAAQAQQQLNNIMKEGLGLFGELNKGIAGMITGFKGFSQDMTQLNDLVASHNQQIIDTTMQRSLQEQRQTEDQNRSDLRAKQAFNKTLAEEDKRQQQQQAKGVADAYAKYDEAGSKEQEAEQKSLQDYYKQSAQASQDYQDNLLKIQKEGHDSVIQDASHLNAEAVLRDQERQRTQTDDATKTYEKDRNRRANDESQKLADMQKSATESRNQNLANALQTLRDNQTAYEQQRQQRINDRNEQLKQQTEDRQIQRNRELEDQKIQDIARDNSYRVQYNNLISKLLGPEQAAKVRSYNQQNKDLNQALSVAKQSWNSFIGGFGKTTTSTSTSRLSSYAGNRGYATGTSNVPQTGLYQLEAGEAVMTPAVASAVRNSLGNGYSQGDLGNFVSKGGKGGGLSIQNFSPQIVLGDIGSRSNAEVEALVVNALHKTLTRLAQGGV